MKNLENFNKALDNLHEGLKLDEPYSIVEKTGIVGLFEICFEQSWKLMKAVLEEHGRYDHTISSPRSILKIAYQCGMVNDCEGWLNLLEARNILLAHTYSDEQSLDIIRQLKTDYIILFDTLKEDLYRRWII